MVGLTTWKAGATFTDYIMKAEDNAELNVIDNLPLQVKTLQTGGMENMTVRKIHIH